MNVTILRLFLGVVLFNCVFGFLVRKPECETSVQDPRIYGCTDSTKECRACCHFDLTVKNEAYGDRYYYLKEAVLVPGSNYCTCEFCRSKAENFNNKPIF